MNKDNIEEEKIEAQYFYLAKWMDGKCTLEALKKHVSQDDINAYKKLKDGLEVYEYLNAPTKASFVKIKSRINKKKKKTQQLYKQIALSAAAVVTVLLMLNLFVSTNKFSYSTEYAEHKSINLPDGSEVILNAKSQLTFNKKTWNNNRELYLNGEAYFKVKTGNTFTVKTDNGSVLVLGTQFNVNAYNEDFKVNCYEGEVKVISNNNTTVLKPQQSVLKIKGNIQENKNFKGYKQPTWISGESTFRSVPLNYAITALENQYNVKINKGLIDDSKIFTGSFTHSNLNLALATVFKTMQISYIENNKIIELSMH